MPVVRPDPAVRLPFGAAGGAAGRHAFGGALRAMASAARTPARGGGAADPDDRAAAVLQGHGNADQRAGDVPRADRKRLRGPPSDGALRRRRRSARTDPAAGGASARVRPAAGRVLPRQAGLQRPDAAGLPAPAAPPALRRGARDRGSGVGRYRWRACGGIPAIIDLDSDLCRQLRDQGSALGRTLARPAGWLRRFALRRAAGALTVSRVLSEVVRTENPAMPVFEINDIPIEGANRQPAAEAMAALRSRLGLAGRRVVVYTGNYDRRQGLPELIQAIAAVRARHPQCLLLVVGGEPEQVEALQARIEADGLADAVRLLGARPPDTMPEYMGLAEALVSPRLEPYTTPLKIFSYMASGRPIVATDLPTHTGGARRRCRDPGAADGGRAGRRYPAGARRSGGRGGAWQKGAAPGRDAPHFCRLQAAPYRLATLPCLVRRRGSLPAKRRSALRGAEWLPALFPGAHLRPPPCMPRRANPWLSLYRCPNGSCSLSEKLLSGCRAKR